MSGSKGMVLMPRDRSVIEDVAEFRVMTRKQLQKRRHFKSRTRANAVLARLVRFGYLSTRAQPIVGGSRRLLYQIGRHAAEFAGRHWKDSQMKQMSDLFLEHHLRTTDVRLEFMDDAADYSMQRWVTDFTLRAMNLGIVPDGYVEYSHGGLNFAAFVELDLGTETLKVWEDKVRAYLSLAFSGKFEATFKHRFFRVLVVTSSQGRLRSLQKGIGRLTPKIFWLTTLEDLYRGGPFTDIWRRPGDPTLHSLKTSQ